MLAHHDSEDSDEPHFRTAMFGGFKPIVDFLSLVGTFDGRSTFVDILPFIAVASDGWKQARIVLRVSVNAPTIGRVRTRRIAGADGLLH